MNPSALFMTFRRCPCAPPTAENVAYALAAGGSPRNVVAFVCPVAASYHAECTSSRAGSSCTVSSLYRSPADVAAAFPAFEKFSGAVLDAVASGDDDTGREFCEECVPLQCVKFRALYVPPARVSAEAPYNAPLWSDTHTKIIDALRATADVPDTVRVKCLDGGEAVLFFATATTVVESLQA